MAIPKTCIISRENLKNSNVGGFQIIVDARPGKSWVKVPKLFQGQKFQH